MISKYKISALPDLQSGRFWAKGFKIRFCQVYNYKRSRLQITTSIWENQGPILRKKANRKSAIGVPCS